MADELAKLRKLERIATEASAGPNPAASIIPKGWLANKVADWASRKQGRELDDFLSRLESMDSSEIGLVVALATTARSTIFATTGHDLLFPSACLIREPLITFRITRLIQGAQKEGNFHGAAGMMVWTHTLRAMTYHSLRPRGRRMWAELQRGFPFVREAAQGYVDMTGATLILHGFDQIPDGLGERA